jgi:hypothetical protein
MFKGLKDRFIRAVQLSKTARDTGKRGVTPEFGVGEFLRGFTDRNLAKSDAEDSKFTTNLKENIKQNVPEDKQALFERDLVADKDRQKQEWLAKTANSPAAKAGMSDDMRWRAHLKNQAFRKEKGRSYTHGDFL